MLKRFLLLVAIGVVSASPSLLSRREALMESETEESSEQLAQTFVNEVSTHEWSKMATEFVAPTLDLPEPPKVETWYINNAEDVDRKECMEKQLTDAGYTPYRFSALETVSTDDFNKCIQNGIEELPQTENLRQVVSNWCNHQRLFEGLQKLPSDAEYFLVLEDTPVINTKRMKAVVDDLIAEYRQNKWSFLQLDPYGGVATPISFHRGMPVFSPSKDIQATQGYQGTHALLVKRSALSQITELMRKRKATEMSDMISQIPSFLAVSAGVAINPMVNKYQQYVPLPAFCQPKEKHSSFIQGDAQNIEEDLWSKWPRATGEFSMAQTAWWTPSAKSWHLASMAEQDKYEKISESKIIETFQIGTADEDPARANCMNQAFRAAGMGKPKRLELLQVSPACSALTSASEYQACLAKNGMDDCSSMGQLDLSDIDSDTDFDRKTKIRDHVVAGTCGFKRALDTVKGAGSPFVLLVNENAVLEQRNLKKKLLDFITDTEKKGKAWSAVQIDPYGHEEPIEKGPIWDPSKATDDQMKSRFYGLHAVLLKREAIPSMLAEIKVGPADRIPRQTSGWLAANLGVAYDPHMAALAGMDGCSEFPSHASHFQISRVEVPEAWGASVKKAMTVDTVQDEMREEEDTSVPRSARQ